MFSLKQSKKINMCYFPTYSVSGTKEVFKLEYNFIIRLLKYKRNIFQHSTRPSYIAYFKDGRRNIETWYFNGIQKRDDGGKPDFIAYDEYDNVYMLYCGRNQLL